MPFDTQGRSGVLKATIVAEHPERITYSADLAYWTDKTGKRVSRWRKRDRYALHLEHHNAYVNTGLNNALDREWGLGGTAIGFIGVDNNSTAVTATTTFLHGASAGTQPPTASANQVIKAISPAATRTNQTTTGGATFANADFTGGGNSVFVINKIGLLTASTDTGSALVDVIGGTGGSSPFNKTFVLDLTGAGTFSATLQIAVTATSA